MICPPMQAAPLAAELATGAWRPASSDPAAAAMMATVEAIRVSVLSSVSAASTQVLSLQNLYFGHLGLDFSNY
jgi:hypothetical protein